MTDVPIGTLVGGGLELFDRFKSKLSPYQTKYLLIFRDQEVSSTAEICTSIRTSPGLLHPSAQSTNFAGWILRWKQLISCIMVRTKMTLKQCNACGRSENEIGGVWICDDCLDLGHSLSNGNERILGHRIETLEKALMIVSGFMSATYGDDMDSSYEVDMVFAALDQAGDLTTCDYPEAREWVDVESYLEKL